MCLICQGMMYEEDGTTVTAVWNAESFTTYMYPIKPLNSRGMVTYGEINKGVELFTEESLSSAVTLNSSVPPLVPVIFDSLYDQGAPSRPIQCVASCGFVSSNVHFSLYIKVLDALHL